MTPFSLYSHGLSSVYTLGGKEGGKEKERKRGRPSISSYMDTNLMEIGAILMTPFKLITFVKILLSNTF